MSLVIRASREADLPAITAIYAHAVRHGTASFELEPPSPKDMARRRQALLEGGFPYLVAEQDGVVRGYAYAGPYRPRPAYRSTVEDYSKQQLKRYRQLVRESWITQELRRVRNFHAAFKHGRWLSTVLMHRDLGPGQAKPPTRPIR